MRDPQGLYEDHEKTAEEQEARERQNEELGVEQKSVFGVQVPASLQGDEWRAVGSGGDVIKPGSATGSLKRAFGAQLPAVKVGGAWALCCWRRVRPGLRAGRHPKRGIAPCWQAAMEELASAIPPTRIGKVAYKLYEIFRQAEGRGTPVATAPPPPPNFSSWSGNRLAGARLTPCPACPALLQARVEGVGGQEHAAPGPRPRAGRHLAG